MADYQLNIKINGVETTVSSIGEIESAIKATNDELKKVQIGTDTFEELTNQAKLLNNELKDTFKEATNFDKSLGQLGQSVARLGSSVAASFAIAQSAVSLFGGESEELTKAQIKAQQALTIALGATTIASNAAKLSGDLKNISDAIGLNLTKSKTSAQIANTGATVAGTTATTAATVATGAFNTVLLANPAILIAAAITTLIGAYVLFSDENEDTAKTISVTNTRLVEQNDLLKQQSSDIIGLIRSKKELAILEEKDVEKRKKLEEDLNKDILKLERGYIAERVDNLRRLSEGNDNLINQLKQTPDITNFINSIQEAADKRLAIEIARAEKEIDNEEALELRKAQLIADGRRDLIKNLESSFQARGKFEDESFKSSFDKIKANVEAEGKIRVDLIKETNSIEDGVRKDQLKKEEEDLKKKRDAWKKAYDDIKNSIKSTFKELSDIEAKYNLDRERAQLKSELERLNFEKDLEDKRIQQIAEVRKKEINDSVLSASEKNKALLELDKLTGSARVAAAQSFSDQITKIEKDQAEFVALVRKTLNEEISFGDNNYLDNKAKIETQERELQTRRLEFQLSAERLNGQQRIEVLEELERRRGELLNLQERDAINDIKSKQALELAEFKNLLIGKDIAEKDQIDLINQFKENQTKELNTKLAQIESDFQNERKALAFETEQEILNQRLKSIGQYLQITSQGITAIGDLQTAKLNDELEAAKGNDKKQEEIRKKAFERQKKLNIAAAFINGAQAVLQAIAQFGPPPSPAGILGIAAATLITGAQVAKIRSQKYSGGGGSEGASLSSGGSAPIGGSEAVRSGAQTGSGLTQFNQDLVGTPNTSSSESRESGGSQRFYVLESDISSVQRRVSVAESLASVG
jgi:hypothetical protein